MKLLKLLVHNLPMIYELKRDLVNTKQGDLTVQQYYSKLRQLWDQLNQLMPPIIVQGTAKDQLDEREQENKIMHFLMGLNDALRQREVQFF